MASTNVKYTVLTNYVNAPTERNFNKIATVFIDDINMIVYSNTYGYEYNIFGEDITSKTLLVLWNKLKDFKLDSDPQIAVSSFTKYLKNIVKNILKREKSEHFKRMSRYLYLDDICGNSEDLNAIETYDVPYEDCGFRRIELRDLFDAVKNSLSGTKRRNFDMVFDSVVNGFGTNDISRKYGIIASKFFLNKHRTIKELRGCIPL